MIKDSQEKGSKWKSVRQKTTTKKQTTTKQTRMWPQLETSFSLIPWWVWSTSCILELVLHWARESIWPICQFSASGCQGWRVGKWSYNLLCNVVSDSAEVNPPGKDQLWVFSNQSLWLLWGKSSSLVKEIWATPRFKPGYSWE